MANYILTVDHENRAGPVVQRIHRVIPKLTAVASVEELLAKVPTSTAEVAYLLIVAPGAHPRQLIECFGGASDIASRFLVLITDQLSAHDYKSLLRRGDADWVSIDADPQEIVDIIERHRALRMASQAASEAGRDRHVAVSFLPSAGGVGNTTLAVEAGIKLKTTKATRDRTICVVDLDFQGSHVCDHLDIEPRLKIQEILDNPERLDAQLFDIFISRHRSGLHVFAAPRSKLDLSEVTIAALDAFFNLANARYDLMLIDLPPLWLGWTPQVLIASDGVIVTGVNTVPGLRQIVDTLAAVRAAGDALHAASATEAPRRSSKIAVAINRCRLRALGGIVNRQHVESVLGSETIFYVGDEPAMLESINTGTPLGLMKSTGRFAKDIAKLASHCAELKPARNAIV